MPRTPPETAESKALREIMAEDDAVLDHLARQAGPPPDSEQLSERELDQLWAIEDRAVSRDPDGFAQKLMTTGLSQQELPTLRILKEHPEWAPAYGQPTQDAEMAEQYTLMAWFPHRWEYLMGFADPAEQVREAERLDRRYQKAHAEKTGVVTETPTPTPDQMPSLEPGAPPQPMPPAQPEQMPSAPPAGMPLSMGG